MDSQFRELAAQITKDVTESVTHAINAHVTEVVQAAEDRLARQARINVEAVKAEARLAAEGYAATVDAINHRLDRIEARLDTKFYSTAAGSGSGAGSRGISTRPPR